MIKPDAVQRNLIGEIISRIENKGLKLVGGKLMQVPTELAEKHYSEHEGKREISLWFNSNEIADYTSPREDWLYE